jgi:glutathione S-transferase
MTAGTDITLWHVPISHYAEKARWALDYKRIPHTRRRLMAGSHPIVTFLLTRGAHQTVPVVTFGRRGVGDSTAIIAELEHRFPDPPLYPADPADRRRALELEDYFDEELGPAIRRLAYHELSRDREAMVELVYKQIPYATGRLQPLLQPGLRMFLDARFGTGSDEKVREAEVKTFEALDRLEAELGGREFLVGDSFTVADLTAASLFYPLALAPEGPWRPENLPPAWSERAAQHADRPGVRWVMETYAHWRTPEAAAQRRAPQAAAAA